ncbi:5'-methylthioadenosine/S-adenosylhomocysteine nucleosidase [Thalassomonas sp. M1454]|uniref:5'-methylthioadenosine/S-adenosylhomocysteine nucleosidase n=1 Tax=Thalassomonas sp. M1454 TaxID=2594477 RepID=UPI00117C45DE|nr:5'-methylthioadenosine/S-adenosylhomocysteine nucleosidase [Thalassomonas sp. M1454]TRX55928.1 5'-methylthioadenosine/S-adenosylhomocysteine nucleosidase [Thalassomonas sp. M1454]
MVTPKLAFAKDTPINSGLKAGIIGAMEPEVAILKSKIKGLSETKIAGYVFYSGKIDGSEVVLVQSGIGKVAATIATVLMIDKFQPDYIVNTGSAGGFEQSLKVGDIVISSEVRHHDADVTAFGYEIGQLPGMPAAFIPHPTLVTAAQAGIDKLDGIKTLTGLITTGDTFMTKDDDIAKARANFPTMAAVEMEGAAIAQTCHQMNVPFVVIRSMSDIAGKESPTSFEEYLETASVNSSKLVMNMLNELKGTNLN